MSCVAALSFVYLLQQVSRALMNSFEQQGADWEKQITLLSGRPPAKVSQSQTTGCCLHSCRPFLSASRTLTALSKNIPPPTFPPHHLFYVVSNHLSSPPPKKKLPPLLCLPLITSFTFTWVHDLLFSPLPKDSAMFFRHHSCACLAEEPPFLHAH